MERNDVYKLLDGEREYQDKVWIHDSTPIGAHQHTPTEWLVYLQKYVTDAMVIATQYPDPVANEMIMETIRKISAMGVAAMEQHDTKPRALGTIL